MNNYDVIIIGSGPAGLTAAIYTSRAMLKTLVISGPQPGGQLTTTTDVENFPGFADGVGGTALLEQMRKQAERFGTLVVNDEISNIKNQKSNIHIKNQKENTFNLSGKINNYQTRAVIIATGAEAKKLGILSEEKFRGKGVSYCATCDGFFFRGKNVAVLGGGDTAMEEATFLTRFASYVTIIHRRSEFRACPMMLAKAKKDPKISFLTSMAVEEFYGDAGLEGIKLRKIGMSEKNGIKEENELIDFPVDGAFVAIGHTPSTAFLQGFVERDEQGYILTKSQIPNYNPPAGGPNSKQIPISNFQTQTSVPGVFAAGDCADSHYRQAIVAAGFGAMAALDAQHWLEE